MATTRTPPSSWIDAGFEALASGGPRAVRVEALARDLGVSKGGFYWHFANREALLEQMLVAWEQAGVDDVIAEVEREGEGGRERLRHLFELATAGDDLLRVDLSVREWARQDRQVLRRLRRVDNRRLEFMRSLFREFCDDEDEVEARCLLAASLWVGNHFLAAEHDGRDRASVLEGALAVLLR